MMRTIATCLFCGSPHHELRFRASDRWFNIQGLYDVRQCKQCGLLFLNPQPSPEDLAAHYPANYYAFQGERPDDPRDERLYKIFFGRGSSVLRKAVSLPYRLILRTMVARPGDRVLDVGCGSGHFLAFTKAIVDVDAYGVEPHPFDTAFAARNHLNIFNGTLEQASFPKDFFDVITLNHVFEHLSDPRSTLRELRRILKQNGTVIIAVPQSRCLLYWMFGELWFQLDVPRHLFVPSCRNLAELAESEGFKLVRIRHNGRPETILATLFYWHNHIHKRRRYFCEYQQWRFAFRILLPIAYLLNWLKMGDQIEMILTSK